MLVTNKRIFWNWWIIYCGYHIMVLVIPCFKQSVTGTYGPTGLQRYKIQTSIFELTTSPPPFE